VVVVVVVDWEPVSFPDGEVLVLLDVLSIESNVFSMSLITALFMESERLGISDLNERYEEYGQYDKREVHSVKWISKYK
jgi:hypothetical protein